MTGRRPKRSDSAPWIGRDDELHGGPGGADQAEHFGRSRAVAGKEIRHQPRPDRNDDPEREHVEQDGDEDEHHRPRCAAALPHPHPSWKGRTPQPRPGTRPERRTGASVLGRTIDLARPGDRRHASPNADRRESHGRAPPCRPCRWRGSARPGRNRRSCPRPVLGFRLSASPSRRAAPDNRGPAESTPWALPRRRRHRHRRRRVCAARRQRWLRRRPSSRPRPSRCR